MTFENAIDLLVEAERTKYVRVYDAKGGTNFSTERLAEGALPIYDKDVASKFSFPTHRRPPAPRSGFVGIQPQSLPAGALFTHDYKYPDAK